MARTSKQENGDSNIGIHWKHGRKIYAPKKNKVLDYWCFLEYGFNTQ